jgi:hypothetical protein
MENLYRRDYQGEYVVFLTTKVKGKVEQIREWIPNTINERHTGRAVVFGNGRTRTELNAPFNVFFDHKGGLHATFKLTTYGCNAFYRDANPHILVAKHPAMAKEIVESGYADDHIVVTTAKNILTYPDKFHIIPFDPGFAAGPTALYLAAFDGHNHVYFLGFDGHEVLGVNNNVYAGTNSYAAPTADVTSEVWEAQAKKVFDTYGHVDFIRVMPTSSYKMPESWKYCSNLRQIDFKQFISEADIGVT